MPSRIQCCLWAAGVVCIAILPGVAHAAPTFSIYGFAQTDFIYDADRVDPAWTDTLRPSKIPTVEGIFGSDGQTEFSAKQSRLGVSGDMPLGGDLGSVAFKFEFDAFGVGDDAGQTTIRFRHMYGEWGPLLAGQTNTLFMDIDVFPNVIDYWGPTGMVFLRDPQIRLTPWRTAQSHFSIALEKPGNDIDPGQIREIDPGIAANLHNDEKLPDLTAQYYTSGDWGHVQLAGILRDIGYDSWGTPDNRPKASTVGWGLNLGTNINVLEKDKLIGQVVYGQGIASYMNDGGVDLGPSGTIGDVRGKAVPLLGVVAYFDHHWNDEFATSLGYSLTQVDNTMLQEASAFQKGEYASINLLYTPSPKVLLGGEVLWGRRTDNDEATGNDVRFQFSVKYNFGADITL